MVWQWSILRNSITVLLGFKQRLQMTMATSSNFRRWQQQQQQRPYLGQGRIVMSSLMELCQEEEWSYSRATHEKITLQVIELHDCWR